MNTIRHRISVTFDDDTYKQIKNIADRNGVSIAEVVRKNNEEILSGQLSKDNINWISRIIRQELKSILERYFERIIALQAKTCIQAGAAAYLSAEALASFVPDSLQKDFLDAYEAARKKAIKYTRDHSDDPA